MRFFSSTLSSTGGVDNKREQLAGRQSDGGWHGREWEGRTLGSLTPDRAEKKGGKDAGQSNKGGQGRDEGRTGRRAVK